MKHSDDESTWGLFYRGSSTNYKDSTTLELSMRIDNIFQSADYSTWDLGRGTKRSSMS
jgi:hypothetical protein